jgi:PAS domain S-box-containing protein
MLGYTREALSAKSVLDIDPNVTPDSWPAIWQTLLTQGSDHFETRHRRKDGSEMVVEIHTNLFEYEDQQYAIAFAQDITKRKQADNDLHQLRNYLSNIIDSMSSVLVGVASRGRVSQWNRQAEKATGLGSERALARPLEEVFPRLTNQMDHLQTAIRDRRVTRDLKVPNNEKDEIRYEDVTIFPLVTNGVEGAVIRVDDVTERVRLEELMIQSEKMLSVGGLAAGMAHEINNPLAGILQNAAVLSNRLFEELPANLKAADTAGIRFDALQHYLKLRKLPEMAAAIRSSGLRATTIVENMLGFARKSDRSVSRHDICELLDRTIELVETDYDMKKRYDFKKIRIVREYEAGDRHVSCQASKIQQVFLNLLKNGAEAMAQADAAALERHGSPRFNLRVKNEGDWVRVEVEDNGPGMDVKTRRSVFEPFFTTKPVGEGTGLGLSVPYFIVTEDHGGEMEVYSPPNKGARFVIRLPKAGVEGAINA